MGQTPSKKHERAANLLGKKAGSHVMSGYRFWYFSVSLYSVWVTIIHPLPPLVSRTKHPQTSLPCFFARTSATCNRLSAPLNTGLLFPMVLMQLSQQACDGCALELRVGTLHQTAGNPHSLKLCGLTAEARLVSRHGLKDHG